MKKILVTGCAGFVGSWICDKAMAAGYEIVGIDNYASGVNNTPKGVEFHEKDLNDNIKDIIKDVDAVVHAAAYAELRHNWTTIENRKRLFANNEMATISLLEQMPEVPIVFLSSASVYGSMSHDKITDRALVETDVTPASIESPYAGSKLACEAYISAWSFKRQTPWHTIRLVNQVGSRTHCGVISDFVHMVETNKHIHAADDGKQTKSWVSVKDTAGAVVRLLDSENKVPSGIYTITSAERWSWRDIVRIMLKTHEENHPGTPAPFTLTWEERAGGAVGDPINLHVSGDKLKPYYSCDESIEQSVREALISIGWN